MDEPQPEKKRWNFADIERRLATWLIIATKIIIAILFLIYGYLYIESEKIKLDFEKQRYQLEIEGFELRKKEIQFTESLINSNNSLNKKMDNFKDADLRKRK